MRIQTRPISRTPIRRFRRSRRTVVSTKTMALLPGSRRSIWATPAAADHVGAPTPGSVVRRGKLGALHVQASQRRGNQRGRRVARLRRGPRRLPRTRRRRRREGRRWGRSGVRRRGQGHAERTRRRHVERWSRRRHADIYVIHVPAGTYVLDLVGAGESFAATGYFLISATTSTSRVQGRARRSSMGT